VKGDKDKLVRYENSLLLKEILKPRKFILFPGAGHHLHEVLHSPHSSQLCSQLLNNIDILYLGKSK